MRLIPKLLALGCIVVIMAVDMLISEPAPAPQARPRSAPPLATPPPTSLLPPPNTVPPPPEIPPTTASPAVSVPPATVGDAPGRGTAPESSPGQAPPTTMTLPVPPTTLAREVACGRPGQWSPSTLRHTWPSLTSRAVDHGRVVCTPG